MFSPCRQFESSFFFQIQHRFLQKKKSYNICMLIPSNIFFREVSNWERNSHSRRACLRYLGLTFNIAPFFLIILQCFFLFKLHVHSKIPVHLSMWYLSVTHAWFS